jgi:hypothetical protein
MPGGKFPLDIRITGVRALTKEDVGRLSEPRFVHPTKRLRQSHHQLALLDALGFKTAEISKLTGYSESRVFTLRADPAFQMIVAEKSKAINEAAIREAGDLMAQKARIMAAMDRHILDHIDQMDEAGELVPLKTALAVSADMADRVGYAKHTTHTAFDGDWAKKLEERIAMRPRRTLDFMGKLTETRPPQVVEVEPSKRSGSESPSPPRVPLRLITPNITRR